MSSDKEEQEPRYYGLRSATVLDNKDPKGLYRVRAKVPGIAEEGTAWALPRNQSEGKGKGGASVPDVGADIIVEFLDGDPQRPFWSPGWWGEPSGERDVPSEVADEPAEEAYQMRAFETARYAFLVDEREGKQLLRIKDKLSEDMVEFDGEKCALTIAASSLIHIKGTGMVNIEGTDVQIQGRKVLPGDKPI